MTTPRRYWNYGRTESAVPAREHAPTSTDALGALLAEVSAHDAGGAEPRRHLTLRAAGQAFGRTALPAPGGEIVRLDGLPPPAVSIAEEEGRLVVSADGWATWGAVFDAVRAFGDGLYVPVQCPTSRRVTVAGYLAADGLSRFSPVVGKFSHAVLWLRVRRPSDGRAIVLVHPDRYGDPSSPTAELSEADNRRAFRALVGGCGLVAFVEHVVFVVHRVERTGDAADAPRLRAWTRLGRYDSYDTLLRAIVAWQQRYASEREDRMRAPLERELLEPRAHMAPSGFVLMNDAKGDLERGALAITGLTDASGPTKSFLLWNRSNLRTTFRAMLDLRMLPKQAAFADTLLWQAMGRVKDTVGRDELCDYTFFFEAHSYVRDALTRLGRRPQAHTQCYLIPLGRYDDPEGWDTARALTFLRGARAALRGKDGVRVQAIDALFMPPSESTLAGLPDQAALLCTLSLEGVHNYRGQKVDKVRVAVGFEGVTAAFERVSAIAASLGGRVQVGKQVYARDADLQRMMHAAAVTFLADAAVLDPHRALGSRFLDEVIAVAAAAEGGDPPPFELERPGTEPPRPLDGFDPLTQDVYTLVALPDDMPASELPFDDCDGRGSRAATFDDDDPPIDGLLEQLVERASGG